MLKKFDFYAQVSIIIIAVILAIASLFVGSYFFGSLLLLLPLGLWQLISAACHYFSTTATGNKQILRYYWACSMACITIFVLALLLRDNDGNELAMGMLFVAMSGSFLTALYYLYLYKKYLLHAKPTEEDGGIGGI
jgi:hypothetical protein